MVKDSKDWTWVLERACPECGFDASAVAAQTVPDVLLRATGELAAVLDRPDVALRPSPEVWSPLEYVCHVSDTCRVFSERLALMLETEAPEFANWDQDETAAEERYAEQDPAEVRVVLEQRAQQLAGQFRAVADDQWERTGLRSDGSLFTVRTLGQYLVHDPVHHVWDVTGAPQG